jgi:integrase
MKGNGMETLNDQAKTTEARPVVNLMSWSEKQKRWKRTYRGKPYFISTRQLCTAPTEEASRQAANEWWTRKQEQVDELLGDRPTLTIQDLIQCQSVGSETSIGGHNRPPQTLREFLCWEFIPEKLGMRLGTAKLCVTVVNRLEQWAARPVTLESLTHWLVVNHLRDFLKGHAPATVNSQRRLLLQLWKEAADRGYCDPPKRKIPTVPEPQPAPEAWTTEEYSRLLEACRRLGPNRRLPWRSLWWESLWTAVYWTGTRINALLSARLEDFDPATGGLILQPSNAKSRKTQRVRLPVQAAALIAHSLDMEPYRAKIWPWPFDRSWLWREARKIITAAGIPCPEGESRQLFHRARRTCISYCWAADPAVAQFQAGHSSATLTKKHYVDVRIAGQRTAVDVLPPV